MKKVLQFLDTHLLRFGVAFAILFIPLYPKLPSINIDNTWVYIRLEDFVILALAVIWFVLLLRKKISLPKPEGYAIILYWFVGLVSLLYVITILAPTMQNFFPSVAWLQYLRRIEYMILFFIAFSSVKSIKDLYFYLVTLCIAVVGIIIYGFGQRFYLFVWNAFPEVFKDSTFCFPAFLTGNEEFAKGFPLCLDEASRITATFGGHYDLAAYLVMVLPILIALVFGLKRWYLKVLVAILALFALELLNFTSSRTSVGAYVVAVVSMLVIWQKKRWIVPILLVSIGVMLLFSNSTIQRFANTVQPVQVVSIPEGTSEQDLQDAISQAKETEANKTPETPPPGTVTLGETGSLGGGSKQILTNETIEELARQNISISSQSGAFLIQKAYALDISFTTRFEAEWPRNWAAFLSSPLLGTGYSSLTLATDNDYLRALGETGVLGLLSFLFIFLILGIFMRQTIGSVKDNVGNAYLYGLAGGVIGLLTNAVLIDVFEASKVAEPLWILLGIGVGVGKLYQKQTINYTKELYRFFTSHIMMLVYLLLLILITYVASINNFFVGDDFTWLRWAATADNADLLGYFTNAQNFFYRPLDKVVMHYLYLLFSFQPQGYHLFTLFLHFLTVTGVYFLTTMISKRKLIGVLTAVIFALHPAHTENMYWLSTLSMQMSSMFIVFTLLAYLHFRRNNAWWAYVVAIILSALAFVSYEISVIIPLLLVAIDVFIVRKGNVKKTLLLYVPFVLLVIAYFVVRSMSQAFAGGGDYSYNMLRLVPNVVGNYFGYIGLFIAGISFLEMYDSLREGLRAQWQVVSVVLVAVIATLSWFIYRSRKHVNKLMKNEKAIIIFFGFIFAFVALLPFLPLGNIATRYIYLASAGFSLSMVLLLYVVLQHLLRKQKLIGVIMVILVACLASVYYTQNVIESKKWETSGKITRDTLLFFRKGYASFTPETQIYIVNTPVKQNGVWVFPVGLKDGIWFIYRNQTPQIEQLGSVEEAQRASQASDAEKVYIFRFDEQGKIEEVK